MDKIVGKMIDILEKIMTVLLGVAAILVVMQIFWRYVLRDPLGWTDQGCRFVFVWMCMFGLLVLFYRKSVVAFDLIVGKLKGKTCGYCRNCLYTYWAVLCCLFFDCKRAILHKNRSQNYTRVLQCSVQRGL